ncbi:cysteine hydrolase family protein [Desulfosarcina widdelii]|uniref:cysteine hydrolase family protein n=1 Tax=Desulfosarcina widdelii TaxID=947919 RepID=UPI0012D35000|nr:isochorismatase family cysteine hydrolase [Desulfosarcina widdelii]
MVQRKSEKPALLVIDMVKDNFDETRNLPITPLAKAVIPAINRMSDSFRQHNWPVVFPTDAFHEDDFFFTERMHPHSLAGTPGAEIVTDLTYLPTDYWMPKPGMSAFFKTELETWLSNRQITLCALAGIATNFCVLTSAMDALSHNFKVVILEDCCAAATEVIHQKTLSLYRKPPLFPLLRVMPSTDFLSGLKIR